MSTSPVETVLAQAGAGRTPESCDVAILVALKEEWEILWTTAGKPGGDKDPESGRYLFRFQVTSESGRAYRCVALFIGEMGPGQATNAAEPLLRERPKVIVNVGIAAALHDDLRLCDVIVAEQVDDYLGTTKATPRGKKSWAFEFRGSVYKTTHALVQEVDTLKYAHPDVFERWQATCHISQSTAQRAKALKSGMIREAPEIVRVHLASGPVLAAAEAFSQWVRKRDGLLKALEMEAAGMMLAAHHRSEPMPTLVLRGISDYGDSRKAKTDKKSGGAFRSQAMVNATELLWSLMRRGLLPRHPDGSVGVAQAAGVLPQISKAPQEYFARWLRDDALFHHRWPMVGRSELCDSILDALTRPSPPWILLEGRGGIGKTRLLLELWHRLQERGVRVLAYVEGSILSAEGLGVEECAEQTVILVDDVQRLAETEVERLTKEFASRRFNVTPLMAGRKIGSPMISGACIRANIELRRFEVTNLTDKERCTLATNALGPEHKHFAEHLAATFHDSPLLITLGGVEIRLGKIAPEKVKTDTLLREQVFARFPSTIGGDRQAIEALTAIASLLSRITTAELRALGPVVWDDVPLWTKSFEKLLDLGIFADVNGVLRILPDLYGSYAVMQWAVPHGVASGRLVELWQRLPSRWRVPFLRNIPELTREVASSLECEALRAELRQIWVEQHSALGSPSDDEARRCLVALARELPTDALRVAHEFITNPDPLDNSDGRGRIAVELIIKAAEACTEDNHDLHAYVIECVRALLVTGASSNEAHALEGLAAITHFLDALIELPDLVLDAGGSGAAITVATHLAVSAYRALIRRLDHGETSLLHLLDRQGRLAQCIIRAFVAAADGEAIEIAKDLSEAILATYRPNRSLPPQLAGDVVAGFQSVYRQLHIATATRSASLEYAVRGLVTDAAWRTSGAMGDAVFRVLPVEEPNLNPLQQVLLLEHLPGSRHRTRLSEEHLRIRERGGDYCGSGSVEIQRRDSLIKFIRSAPDLRALGLPFGEAEWSTRLARFVFDASLKGPVRTVKLGRAWVSILSDNQTEALGSVLAHVLRDEQSPPPSKRVPYFIQMRLDEYFARAVVRYSGPTQALGVASTYAAADLELLAQASRDVAKALVTAYATAEEAWSAIREEAESLSHAACPNRYAVLYSIVNERPEWAVPFAEQALFEGALSVDTISAILQALWQADRPRARLLAQSLLERAPGVAHPVGVVLARWMSTSDELELARSLLALGDLLDKEARGATCMALGVLMARAPTAALEILSAIPAEQWDVEPLLQGFLTSHSTSDTYSLPYCEHVDQLLAPTGRFFAEHTVHPGEMLGVYYIGGNLPELLGFTPAREHPLVRLSRIHAADAPAWNAIPTSLERCLYRAMAANRTFDSPNSQIFIVERARHTAVATLRSVLVSHTATTTPIAMPECLLEALLRPHLRAVSLTELVDVIIDVMAMQDGSESISKAILSCMWILGGEFRGRLDAHAPGDDRLLLGLARVFARADLRTILASSQLLTRLFDKAEHESPATRRSILEIMRPWSRERIAEITLANEHQVRSHLDSVNRLLMEVGEQASVAKLYRQIWRRLYERVERDEVEQRC